MMLFLVLGYSKIMNRIKLMIFYRRGWRKVALISYSGEVIEYVKPIEPTIRIGSDTYFYRPEKEYVYGDAGNIWKEGKSNPLNMEKLIQGVGKASMDSKIVDTLIVRSFGLGRIAGEKQQQFMFWMLIIIIMLSGFSAVVSIF